ncbi:aminoacyl-tRNA hydrolase [Vallicoccus soli]|uniref:Peptidyl-tRNA hydrolase n=1 Tax=Vallicoccus soli TaxID=2339232 RepID=A0A3A3Z384_9ACTN|nr:aminoacyl-tRNA hydrolase [Vallicoccus soli]RJK97862.1 aminoacyl-tRNA hydrolase [Vallicoccus soli]
MAQDRWVVIGLGNPGPEYAGTRHNVGHLVVDALAARGVGRLSPSRRTRSDVAEGRLGGPGGVPVVLARPRSYMNESGGPGAALRDYYDVPPERLVVVHDELDLPFGSLRCKLGGGDNGHNGLKSLRRSLGTGDFLRVRVGIGRPPGRMDPATYVLRDFSGAERKELDLVVETAADAVESLCVDGLERTQAAFNS